MPGRRPLRSVKHHQNGRSGLRYGLSHSPSFNDAGERDVPGLVRSYRTLDRHSLVVYDRAMILPSTIVP